MIDKITDTMQKWLTCFMWVVTIICTILFGVSFAYYMIRDIVAMFCW